MRLLGDDKQARPRFSGRDALVEVPRHRFPVVRDHDPGLLGGKFEQPARESTNHG